MAELLYGIYEQIESGGNWTHLLFPMSEPEEKRKILARIQGSSGELRSLMLERCEFPEVFTGVIDAGLAMGAGELILQCLEPDPTKRVLVEAALDHPFWSAEPPPG